MPGHRSTIGLVSRAYGALGLLSALVAAAPGCDAAVDISNAAPRVTWVAIQPPAAEGGEAEITLWILDREGDPVDVAATALVDGQARDLVLAPTSHGLEGLTTRDGRFDPNGQPHLLVWDTTGLAGAQTVQLRFAPRDTHGAAGAEAQSPAFTLSAGLPDAVALEPLATK